MDQEESGGNKLKLLLVIALIVGLSALLIWFLSGLFTQEIEPPKQTVQEIKVIRPPPPPPEVEEEPPPPEPEVEEEVEIPEPEEMPDMPDMEPPPSDQLGLDAEGGAGSDAFGLLGNKGGRGLISGSGGSALGWYKTIIQSDLLSYLSEDKNIRTKSYSIDIQIWYSGDGSVDRVKLLNTTGNKELDSKIQSSLNGFKRFSEPPADGKGTWVKIRLSSKV